MKSMSARDHNGHRPTVQRIRVHLCCIIVILTIFNCLKVETLVKKNTIFNVVRFVYMGMFSFVSFCMYTAINKRSCFILTVNQVKWLLAHHVCRHDPSMIYSSAAEMSFCGHVSSIERVRLGAFMCLSV